MSVERPATDDHVDTARSDTTETSPADRTASPVQQFGAGDLAMVRRVTAGWAASAGLDRERGTDLVYAVNEAATNAIEHGGGYGTLRALWDDTHIVISVSSPAGADLDPATGSLPPDPGAGRGRGMWLIRQLTDLVELCPDPPAVTVRLHMRVGD